MRKSIGSPSVTEPRSSCAIFRVARVRRSLDGWDGRLGLSKAGVPEDGKSSGDVFSVEASHHRLP
jgi:hypothetical protein